MDRADAERTRIFPVLAILLAGVVTLYWSVVPRMVADWWNDPNFSHGFLVPLFSAYLIYERRDRLTIFPAGGSVTPGLVIVLAGLVMLVVGRAGAEYFTARSSLVLVLGGTFFIIFGGKGFKACAFPLFFLVFMVPIPYILYDAISFPLKLLASWIGEHSLAVVGVPVLREGNIIHLPNIQLEVADACSGIRSLMSLVALSAATAYFLRLGPAKGTLLVALAVPVSIVTNSFRIFATGILSYRFGGKAAEGFFHEFSGLAVFVAGAALVFLLGAIVRPRSRRKG